MILCQVYCCTISKNLKLTKKEILVLAYNYKIVNPKEVFRGLTYGQWAGVWYNNLMSDKPDVFYREGKSIAFLRGNVEFSYEKQEDTKNKVFSAMTNEQRIIIQDDTAVFIPIISTMLVLGENYQGEAMNDELSLRSAARKDTVNGGPVGAQIKKRFGATRPVSRLVPNELGELDDYYAETSLFPLSVSQASLIRKTIEDPIEPGPYQAVVAGIFVIIYDLEPGKYRLSFYGRGVGRYTTRSVYDIDVLKGGSKLKDVSDPRITSNNLDGEGNPMEFVSQI
jgi:hypothetical protein